jgi:hypothetical protein
MNMSPETKTLVEETIEWFKKTYHLDEPSEILLKEMINGVYIDGCSQTAKEINSLITDTLLTHN